MREKYAHFIHPYQIPGKAIYLDVQHRSVLLSE